MAAICAVAGASMAGCGGSGGASLKAGDTVSVATVYGPASYFEYKDTMMGYDYELMSLLASDKGVAVKWLVAGSVEEALEMVTSGRALVVAADVPVNGVPLKGVRLCGPENHVEQVLVQPPGDTIVADVAQLAGQTVYVEKGSKGEAELQRLNRDEGLDINIRPVDADSLATEDMLAAVAHGDIRLAIVDRVTAKLNQTYYPDLAITLALTPPVPARWAVAKANRALARQIDNFFAKPVHACEQKDIFAKYLETLKNQPVPGAGYDRAFNNGYASPYDDLYKEHTRQSLWDWRLLAAQGFTESRFNPTARSWAGATGVMQIMPGTARQFGLSPKDMYDPSRSIETAVKILDACDEIMANHVSDPIERQKFVMASYNAGPGHVLDAIRLAKKYGYDPEVWDGNVEQAMLMKMNRKYYRDPVVRHGYSRGRETVDYVDRIWNYYEDAITKVPA